MLCFFRGGVQNKPEKVAVKQETALPGDKLIDSDVRRAKAPSYHLVVGLILGYGRLAMLGHSDGG